MSYVMVAAAVVGVAKSEFVDKPQADKQRKLAAATQQYSPWTGLKAQPVKEADPLGSALSFGATGAQINNGMKQTDINSKLADRAMQGGSSPGYSPYGGGGAWQPQQSQDPYSVWGSMNNQGG